MSKEAAIHAIFLILYQNVHNFIWIDRYPDYLGKDTAFHPS